MLSAEVALIAAANQTLSQHRASRVTEEVSACPSPTGALTYDWIGAILALAMTPRDGSIHMQVREVEVVEGGTPILLSDCLPELVTAVSPLLRPTLVSSIIWGLKWGLDRDSRPAGLIDMWWQVSEGGGRIGAVLIHALADGRLLSVRYGDAVHNGSSRTETLTWEALMPLVAICESLAPSVAQDPAVALAARTTEAWAATASMADDDDDEAPGEQPANSPPVVLH